MYNCSDDMCACDMNVKRMNYKSLLVNRARRFSRLWGILQFDHDYASFDFAVLNSSTGEPCSTGRGTFEGESWMRTMRAGLVRRGSARSPPHA